MPELSVFATCSSFFNERGNTEVAAKDISHLTLAERCMIEASIKNGSTQTAIAQCVGNAQLSAREIGRITAVSWRFSHSRRG